MFKRLPHLLATALVGALVALAPSTGFTQARDGVTTAPVTVPPLSLEAQIRTLKAAIAARQTEVVSLQKIADRVNVCAARGMGYAPNHTQAESATGCVFLGPGLLVNEIKFTTATTTGNMNASGYTTSYTRMTNFINNNGCPASEGWRVCTEEDIQFGYTRNDTIQDLDTLSGTAWVYGIDTMRYTALELGGFPPTLTAAPNIIGCISWSNADNYRYGTSIRMNTGGRNGFALSQCDTLARVACCR